MAYDNQPIILSHFQTRHLLQSRKSGKQRAEISPDLGLSTVEVNLTHEGITFPGGESLGWEKVEKISDSENSCFLIEGDEAIKIARFSEFTNQLYSLMPTEGAPTMLISGLPMHRIKGIDPHKDTLEKIKTVKPIVGHVLDTATGLGYTAIQAAKTAAHVTTIELDPVALEITRHNPWSQTLFGNPRITQRIGDSFDIVQEFESGIFARVIHDPPAFKLAGHLYSSEFYTELHRVMQGGARLFHYIGNPESKSGRVTTRGVVQRLQETGFRNVQRRRRAFGVVASK